MAFAMTIFHVVQAADELYISGPTESVCFDITAGLTSIYAQDGDISYDVEDLAGNWIAHIQVNVENYNGAGYLHVYVDTADGVTGGGTGSGGGSDTADCSICLGGFHTDYGLRITSSSGYNVQYAAINRFEYNNGTYLGDPYYTAHVVTCIY